MKNQSIGQSILESVKEVVAAEVRRDIEESLDERDGKVQLESYGTPKVDGQTIRIPVVVGTVLEDYDLESMVDKVDQKWLDKKGAAILQRLVLAMNDPDPYMSRRRGATIYFETDQFKLEYLEGNIVRLSTTVVCDLRPLLGSVTNLRWEISRTIRELAGRKPNMGGELKAR